MKKIEKNGILVYIVSNSKNEVVAVYSNNNEVEVKAVVSPEDWKIIRQHKIQSIYKVTTIECDCDPWTGMGRQQSHYETICSCIGFEPQPRISACFGCWEWPVIYRSEKEQQVAKEYLMDLYNQGLCRYASW